MLRRLIARHAPHDAGADSADVRYLLRTLERIPRRELPDGPTRAALVEAIRAGRVDNLYQPMGCDHWNIAWADRPAWVDPRQSLGAFMLETLERVTWEQQQGGQA